MAITYHVKVSFEGTPEEVLAELKGAAYQTITNRNLHDSKEFIERYV